MGKAPFKIVVAEPFSEDAIARLEEVGRVEILEDSSPNALIEALEGAHALLVRAKAHVTARVINAAPDLKVIGRASPTVDHIDLRAAGRREIRVVYSPTAAVDSCAEFALAMLLSLRRRLSYYDQQLRQGKFDALRMPTELSIGATRIGILGIDPVAERFGQALQSAFGCELRVHDPWGVTPETFTAESVGLETLLRESDALCVFVKPHRDTRGLLNADLLSLMRPTSLLVNLSRGIVDTTALAAALSERRIGGAALDAYESDPLASDHPIRRAPNCILTPHIAGMTIDAIEGRYGVAEDVIRVLQGATPHHEFTPPPSR
ncbi:MAG TPA: NAD(P)-dependent oxidoreductase [Phycisphaerae bacterium]|nr:NAD(P)-dependent oxidoreductase [Phycisphaerae bacterium]HRW51592.1 NAD(P)-dependent oxidoreductase [Phycisphaerae bacterium]